MHKNLGLDIKKLRKVYSDKIEIMSKYMTPIESRKYFIKQLSIGFSPEKEELVVVNENMSEL